MAFEASETDNLEQALREFSMPPGWELHEPSEEVPWGLGVPPTLQQTRDATPEYAAFRADLMKRADMAVGRVLFASVKVATELRYGLGQEGREHTYREIGQELGVSRTTAAKKVKAAHRKLKDPLYPAREYSTLDQEDVTNTGLNPTTFRFEPVVFRPRPKDVKKEREGRHEPKYSPKQLTKQKAWLAEIAAKQAAGQLTFVKGALLENPLPESVQKYLDRSQDYWQARRIKSFGSELRKAIANCDLAPEEQRVQDIQSAHALVANLRFQLEEAEARLAELEGQPESGPEA